MFHKKTEEEIDVAAELERKRLESENDGRPVEGGRGRAQLGGVKMRAPGAKIFTTIVLLLALVVLAIFAWKYYQNKYSETATSEEATPEQKAEKNTQIKNTLPPVNVTSASAPAEADESPAPTPAADAQPAPTGTTAVDAGAPTQPTQQPQQLGPDGKPVLPLAERVRQRRLKAGMSTDEKSNGEVPAAQAGSADTQGGSLYQTSGTPGSSNSDDLSSRLQAPKLSATAAVMMGDRNYLLTAGQSIDCTLDTRIDSTVPGQVICYGSRDVYSANGKIKLLEKSTKYIGYYKGGLLQGQARIFVAWALAETPHGVTVQLDSPGSDPLGGAGLPGQVDTHFWQRFGGAIMLSLINDFAAAAAQTNSSNNSQINFSNTSQSAQDMAAEALKNSINIPPTLYKHHGEHITISVVRNIDFRGVYGIRRTR